MTNPGSEHTFRTGLLYGIGAYGLWGIIPLYFRLVRDVPPLDVLAHRIVWSSLALLIVIFATGRGGEWVRVWKSPRIVAGLSISTVLIALNWFAYIYAVSTRQVLQASLGYFITPLANVLLGVVVLRERMRPLQVVALGAATAGVVYQTWMGGIFPTVALALAVSFSCYGLVRKLVPVVSLLGLSVETMLLFIPALIYLVLTPSSIDHHVEMFATLALGGPVTIVPLLLFAGAARRLPLTTMGFLQFLAPSLQFLMALFVLQEPLRPGQGLSFGMIWVAVGIYALDAWRATQQRALFREASEDLR